MRWLEIIKLWSSATLKYLPNTRTQNKNVIRTTHSLHIEKTVPLSTRSQGK